METPVFRCRIYYAKTAALRYTGHLDTLRAWERMVRRARLPLAYSQGFHPQPRIQQACALPLGFTSQAEIVDLWLTEHFDPAILKQKLCAAAQPGIEIEQVEQVDLREPALQTRVRAAEYRAGFLDPVGQADLSEKVADLLATAALPREKRGKTYDLRPLVLELACLPGGESPVLVMRLSAREGATGRPEEVLSALGLDPSAARVVRTAVEIE